MTHNGDPDRIAYLLATAEARAATGCHRPVR